MQKITRDLLLEKASSLLKNGVVNRVLGWKSGDFDYDVTPAVFETEEELKKDFVYGDFCGANFSKYLIKETKKSEEKVLVFLKPCDTYSFNQLLTEHRFDRERVYAVGIPCQGMADIHKIRSLAGEGILGAEAKEGQRAHKRRLYRQRVLLALRFPVNCGRQGPGQGYVGIRSAL